MKQLAQDWAVPEGDNTTLTAEKQYRREIAQLCSLTEEQEAELVTQARTGDKLARQRLIESYLRLVAGLASRYANHYHIEYMEVVGIGNWLLVEHLDRALTFNRPGAYLTVILPYRMNDYCICHLTPIRKSTTYGVPNKCVLSLDRPLISDDPNSGTLADLVADPGSDPAEAERDYTLLYQAIKRLRPGQREVILRRYGFMGRDPQDLRTIARELYGGSSQIGTAVHRHSWGIAALRKQLAPVYAQRGQAERPQA
jgi:DNA-directed RNA polymerase sigma subunit (sigma70/sigma32)